MGGFLDWVKVCRSLWILMVKPIGFTPSTSKGYDVPILETIMASTSSHDFEQNSISSKNDGLIFCYPANE